MKKIFLILAVLMLAAPVMAEPNNITITATVVDSDYPAEVEITYAVTTGKIPRAFALDITVTAGTIVDIGNFFVGECNDSNGYGIFPANFNRYINADFNNWDDVNYTPVADVNDLPGDTEGGIGTGGITIEMGSLYDVSKGKGPPEDSGTLCSIFVDSDCHVDLALNVGRAGIVMEDGNQPDDVNLVEEDVTVVCTVPDVEGDVNLMAQVTIQGANFGIGDITTACSDTIADGNVISTDPAAGVATCGTDVNIVVSTGQPTVPNVLDMNEADAIAAINAVDYISAGTPTYECNDVEAAGEVLSTTPGAGSSASCGATVAIVVSTGPCPCTISGTITGAAPKDTGLAGVTILGLPGSPVTDVNGYYSDTVSPGWSGTAEPNKVQWTFASPNTVYSNVTSDQIDDYTATATECLANTDPGYAFWKANGMWDCWCYRKQCRGDGDGTDFWGVWVTSFDLDAFKLGYNETGVNTDPNICYDMDHVDFWGVRVTSFDLDEFKIYYNEATVSECSSANINEWKN